MNLSDYDKWIYNFQAVQSKYNELHNEDEYIYIEDNEYFAIIPDNIPLI